MTAILELDEVDVALGSGRHRRRVVHGVSLAVGVGETVALVGESGSGKSTLARAAAGLVRPTSGRVSFLGRTVAAGADPRLQLMFQGHALDPLHDVGRLLAEAVPGGVDRPAARAALVDVGLDPALVDRRPHQLSGGQRQRVNLARALLAGPSLLILDEPLSALDVVTQAHIVRLLEAVRRRTGLSYLFITHDLFLARRISDRVVVLEAGRVVEEGPVDDVLRRPTHPYTQDLLRAAEATTVDASGGVSRG